MYKSASLDFVHILLMVHTYFYNAACHDIIDMKFKFSHSTVMNTARLFLILSGIYKYFVKVI